MPNILKNKQLLQQYGLLGELPLNETDSPAYQALIAQYGGTGGILSGKLELLGQQELLPLEAFTKALDPLSVVTAGQEALGGGESMLRALPRRIKEYFAIPKPIPITAPIPTLEEDVQRPGGLQFGIADEPRDLVLPGVGARAADLVSALDVPTEAPVQQPPTPLEQLPAIAGAVTPENILDKAKGGKFASFISNPDFIRFLAEMGSAIGGEGSVGERLGQATIELQRSQIFDQALTKALAGEPFDDLPVHLLSTEERVSLDIQRRDKLKVEADIAKSEQAIAKSKREVEVADITRGEEVTAITESRERIAGKQAETAKARLGETGAEVSDDVIKNTLTKLKAKQGVTFGVVADTGEQRLAFQETFLENIARYPVGEARLEAARFFDPYHKDLKKGDKFYTTTGIRIMVDPEDKENPSELLRGF